MTTAVPDPTRAGDASPAPPLRYAVVVPTIGRPSLLSLLRSLGAAGQDDTDAPQEVVVVDDRAPGAEPLPSLPPVGGRAPRVLVSGGRGPAAARNLGWRATAAPWVAFLDDDVELPGLWRADLLRDLAACAPSVAGSQGRLDVPLPHGRPTDAERGTAGLMGARWATADMAYRRAALLQVGGFDERFPRAYREDADLALRVRRAGWSLEKGRRVTCHPVRPASDWASLQVQAGNADDALMRRLHGRRWRVEADVPRGRLRSHLGVTAGAVVGMLAALRGRRRLAALTSCLWLGMTAEFTARRVLPGPRPGQAGWGSEWRRMLLTSLAIPPAAVAHRLSGEWRWRRRTAQPWPPPLRAVLFDRDATLVEDVPYNGDPELVRPMPGAAEAVRRVRAAGLKVGVVSNQSGIARGLLTRAQVDAVNRRVDDLLGPFDTWQVCAHGPDDGCRCRKPAPGMVLRAARALGVAPQECAVIGDIGADVGAAAAAGARSVLVPTVVTRPEEVDAAPLVAGTLIEAVDVLLDSPPAPPPAVIWGYHPLAGAASRHPGVAQCHDHAGVAPSTGVIMDSRHPGVAQSHDHGGMAPPTGVIWGYHPLAGAGSRHPGVAQFHDHAGVGPDHAGVAPSTGVIWGYHPLAGARSRHPGGTP